jgi:hypothetical protein
MKNTINLTLGYVTLYFASCKMIDACEALCPEIFTERISNGCKKIVGFLFSLAISDVLTRRERESNFELVEFNSNSKSISRNFFNT